MINSQPVYGVRMSELGECDMRFCFFERSRLQSATTYTHTLTVILLPQSTGNDLRKCVLTGGWRAG